MKRFFLLPLILTFVLVFAVFRIILFVDERNKVPSATQTTVETETEEKKEDDQTTENKEKPAVENTQKPADDKEPSENTAETVAYPDNVYKMLDFDRRLILKVGQQEEETCSIYCLAYARAILDSNYSVDPYRYWDDGAVWREAGFRDIASTDPLDKVLVKAYEELDKGRPAIIYTTGTYGVTLTEKPQERSAYEHFILLLGYRANADKDNLKPSDFYGADPASSYKGTEENYVPWIRLEDEAPSLMLNEYALFVPEDPDVHVMTTYAYPDTVRWESESKEIITPNYFQ